LGWALYLPKVWCDDPDRRAKAKIPEEVVFKPKGVLGAELIERAASWGLAKVPVLGDSAYGVNYEVRTRLDDAGVRYVLAVGPDTNVFVPGTEFHPPRARRKGARARPDRDVERVDQLIGRLAEAQLEHVAFRDGPDGQPRTSRFLFTRIRMAWIPRGPGGKNAQWPPREEWLIAEWPEGEPQATDYWVSNLPLDTPHERLARLARLRWKIELDYRQLKGELGLDHYEGRSWLGWYHHTALVTAAHGFLTLERLNPFHPRLA
jgi:SRSO17 transposase